MSARVFNPIIFSEFCTFRSPGTIPCGLTTKKVDKIKKDLFGPTDSFENKRQFKYELIRHQDKAGKKWGFNFRSGYPITTDSRITWKRAARESIPPVYMLSRAAHVRNVNHSPTEQDVLMDARAERENSSAYHARDILQEVIQPEKQNENRLSTTGGPSASGIRQPKITDYMKERKRWPIATKKIPSVKRLRTNTPMPSLGGGSSSSPTCSLP